MAVYDPSIPAVDSISAFTPSYAKALLPQPAPMNGFAALFKSLLNIFSFNRPPLELTYVLPRYEIRYVGDDRLAISSDILKVLEDARVAHQRLLERHPELKV